MGTITCFYSSTTFSSLLSSLDSPYIALFPYSPPMFGAPTFPVGIAYSLLYCLLYHPIKNKVALKPSPHIEVPE